MNAYSEDLRKKIVEAVERGTPKTELARAFGVGVSSVIRYVAASGEGRSLAPKSVRRGLAFDRPESGSKSRSTPLFVPKPVGSCGS
jgi:transposase-like protein